MGRGLLHEFRWLTGVFRGVCYRQHIVDCLEGLRVSGKDKETMGTFRMGVSSRGVWKSNEFPRAIDLSLTPTFL